MRKLISASLVIVSYMISAHTLVWADQPRIQFSPSNVSVEVGETFLTEIIVDTAGVEAAGADAIISYDSAQLEVVSINKGTIFSDYPQTAFDNSQGKMRVSGVVSGPRELYSGRGVLATVEWRALLAGKASVELNFDPGSTVDSNIAVTYGNGDALEAVENLVIDVGLASMGGSAQNNSETVTLADPVVESGKSLLDKAKTIFSDKSSKSEVVAIDPYEPVPSDLPSKQVVETKTYEETGLTAQKLQVPMVVWVVVFLVIALLVVAVIRYLIRSGTKDGSGDLRSTGQKPSHTPLGSVTTGHPTTSHPQPSAHPQPNQPVPPQPAS